MKKQKLVSEFNFEFDLLGITTSVKDYKLTWAINKKLQLNLARQEDHEVIIQNKIFKYVYFLDEPAPELRIRLFSNKPLDKISNNKNLLVPEAPHFDYILMREGESQSFSLNSLSKYLKEVAVIEYLASLNTSNIKFKEHFVF